MSAPGWRHLMRTAVVTAVLGAVGAMAQAQTQVLPSRGELLYTTHCVTCHTTQLHWRSDKQATDWTGITVQVRRWQRASGLAWSDADVTEVSRYLNDTFYKYPPNEGAVGLR